MKNKKKKLKDAHHSPGSKAVGKNRAKSARVKSSRLKASMSPAAQTKLPCRQKNSVTLRWYRRGREIRTKKVFLENNGLSESMLKRRKKPKEGCLALQHSSRRKKGRRRGTLFRQSKAPRPKKPGKNMISSCFRRQSYWLREVNYSNKKRKGWRGRRTKYAGKIILTAFTLISGRDSTRDKWEV